MSTPLLEDEVARLKAEAAALRAALEREVVNLSADRSWCVICRTETPRTPGGRAPHVHARSCALATDAGRGWRSPEQVEQETIKAHADGEAHAIEGVNAGILDHLIERRITALKEAVPNTIARIRALDLSKIGSTGAPVEGGPSEGK